MSIKRVELDGRYSVVLENDSEKQSTELGVESFALIFTSRQEVIDHIELLNKALEFWKYD